MKVRMKFFGAFRGLFDDVERDVVLAGGATVKDLLSALCLSVEQCQKLVDDSGRLKGNVNIILSKGREARLLRDVKTELRDSETVTVFPAITGV